MGGRRFTLYFAWSRPQEYAVEDHEELSTPLNEMCGRAVFVGFTQLMRPLLDDIGESCFVAGLEVESIACPKDHIGEADSWWSRTEFANTPNDPRPLLLPRLRQREHGLVDCVRLLNFVPEPGHSGVHILSFVDRCRLAVRDAVPNKAESTFSPPPPLLRRTSWEKLSFDENSGGVVYNGEKAGRLPKPQLRRVSAADPTHRLLLPDYRPS